MNPLYSYTHKVEGRSLVCQHFENKTLSSTMVFSVMEEKNNFFSFHLINDRTKTRLSERMKFLFPSSLGFRPFRREKQERKTVEVSVKKCRTLTRVFLSLFMHAKYPNPNQGFTSTCVAHIHPSKIGDLAPIKKGIYLGVNC